MDEASFSVRSFHATGPNVPQMPRTNVQGETHHFRVVGENVEPFRNRSDMMQGSRQAQNGFVLQYCLENGKVVLHVMLCDEAAGFLDGGEILSVIANIVYTSLADYFVIDFIF